VSAVSDLAKAMRYAIRHEIARLTRFDLVKKLPEFLGPMPRIALADHPMDILLFIQRRRCL
jgi:hypothetical protein